MSECSINLKNAMSDDLKDKLLNVLKDASESSPASLSQKSLGQAQKSHDAKSVVAAGGIQSFKSRMGLPAGRIDSLSTMNLSGIKDKADALKSNIQEIQSTINDFQSQFPDCSLDPDILNTLNTITTIDSKLSAYSKINIAKLNGEISEAQSKITESTDMQSQADRLKTLFGDSL